MTSKRITAAPLALATFLLFAPTAAWAHPGHEQSGFAHGFMHPFSGFDHLLAMIAVGLFAARLGGRALWAVPLSFISLMAAGGVLGLHGVTLPFVEPVVAASVLAFGLALLARHTWSIPAAMALVGGFAIFHGYAHGAEMPGTSSAGTYGLGFLLATGILHGLGIALGLAVARMHAGNAERLVRFGGITLAFAGTGLLLGQI